MTTPVVRIIGVPVDLGQRHRGVDIGPVAIRYAGLGAALRELGYRDEDLGDIDIPRHYTLADTSYSERLPLIREACERTYRLARAAIQDGTIPIFLGGDHSAAIGSIGGITHDRECGVIWVDAHSDFNTPQTSPSCNIHGMALAILLGQGPQELVDAGRIGAKLRGGNVVLIGLRDVDREERVLLRESGCTIFTMRDIDEQGMYGVLQCALAALDRFDRIHLSLDMDALNANDAPGVGTPVPGGLTYREAQLVMETLCDTGRVRSLDIMEVNPMLDIANRTARTAVSLSASLFGKRIV